MLSLRSCPATIDCGHKRTPSMSSTSSSLSTTSQPHPPSYSHHRSHSLGDVHVATASFRHSTPQLMSHPVSSYSTPLPPLSAGVQRHPQHHRDSSVGNENWSTMSPSQGGSDTSGNEGARLSHPLSDQTNTSSSFVQSQKNDSKEGGVGGKSLKELVSPLNAARLRPLQQQTRTAKVSIHVL